MERMPDETVAATAAWADKVSESHILGMVSLPYSGE
jgi:hypothetical protein